MAILDIILETIVQAVFEAFPRFLGVMIKWIFYLGKKQINEIKKESWNTRIGIVTIIIIFILIYVIFK